MPGADGWSDWWPTGERRWVIVKRRDEYRTLQSQREEIDMETGERRWVPIPHRRSSRISPTGWTRILEHEVTERGEGEVGEVMAWSHRPTTVPDLNEDEWEEIWMRRS